jgi:two-component system response regulator AtoC
VVVLSGLSEAENVVKAMKFGAADYLPKPFDPQELDLVLRRALDSRSTTTATALRPAAETEHEVAGSVTLSAAMERVWALADRVADTDVPVLLVGESGVGKDVVARRVHAASHRAPRPFVKINCAALPGELLESELFGHEKGAFTGAHAEKPGKFELAHQGTIFLDEIGEMDPRLQAKLLQVLQDEEFYRVGGKRSLKVDARVVVGHRPARPPLRGEVLPALQGRPRPHPGRGDGAIPRLRLARQRPRAGEPGPAAGGAQGAFDGAR